MNSKTANLLKAVGAGLACFLLLTKLGIGLPTGLPPGRAGAPGDSGTCLSVGCHAGTDHNASDALLLEVPGGMYYTPGGTRQTWTLTINDDLIVQGFQLTARSGANFDQQAGSFTLPNASGPVEIRCGDGSVKAANCPAARPLEYVQHRERTGLTAYTFDWTPPATDVGEIRIWVAAFKSGTAERQSRQHRKVFTLRPAPANRPVPTVSSGGVGNGFSFTAGVVNNGWITIFGERLGTSTKSWDNSVFGNVLPKQLDGVRVLIDGRPVPVYFVSPGQVNALADTLVTAGTSTVTVVNDLGTSAPVQVARLVTQASFYAPFSSASNFLVTAVAQDGTLVGKRGLDPRVTRGARPGEVLQLFGTGFGPTNPPVTTGLIPAAPAQVTGAFNITLDGRPVERIGAGFLVSPGLYQFNIRVPADAPSGDLALRVSTDGGVSSPANFFLTVER